MVIVKGRHTIRANKPDGRTPRLINPWTFESEGNSTLTRLEGAYLSALDAVDQIEARKTKAAQSGTLAPSGVASDALNYAASTLAPALKKARTAVEQAKHEAAARRAKLVLKPADKSDAAGQLRRLWKLDKYNAMSDSERSQYLARAGDSLDSELAQAFLEAPEYAKVLPSDLEAIHERALKQQHGEAALTELAELESAIKIADDTITAAREEVAHEVGGTAKLDTAAAPFEKMQGAAWLRKFGEEVRSFHVSDNKGHWNVATEEELENGLFFSTAEEWRMAQSGVIPHSMKEKANGGL
jgi:hypothetical protein